MKKQTVAFHSFANAVKKTVSNVKVLWRSQSVYNHEITIQIKRHKNFNKRYLTQNMKIKFMKLMAIALNMLRNYQK
jgi:hypothetical protein